MHIACLMIVWYVFYFSSVSGSTYVDISSSDLSTV